MEMLGFNPKVSPFHPLKPPLMNHQQPYHQRPENPLTGIFLAHRTSLGYTGKFIIWFDQPQEDGARAWAVYYHGTEDSLRKRQELESNGEMIIITDVDK